MDASVKVGVTLALAKFLDTSVFYNVISYLPQTLVKWGASKEDIGLYQESIFNIEMAARSISALFIGPLMDIFGTKSMLIAVMTSFGLSSILIGFSTSATWMVACRTLLGLTNGVELIIRVMLRELRAQPNVIAYINAAPTSLGIALGPVIGGILALPHDQYPDLFGKNTIFDTRPILLPNFVLGCVTLATALWMVYAIPGSHKGTYECIGENNFAADPENCAIKKVNFSDIWVGLCQRDFILSGWALSTSWIGFTVFFAVFSLWLGTPREYAGMSYTPSQTVYVYLWPGLVAFLLDLTIIGPINKCLRPRKAYAFWAIMNAFFVALMPVTGCIRSRLGMNVSVNIILSAIRTATSGCNAVSVSLINNSVQPHVLGLANGVTIGVGSLMTLAVGLFIGKLYSWSISNELSVNSTGLGFPCNHYFCFYVLAMILLCGMCTVFVHKKVDYR